MVPRTEHSAPASLKAKEQELRHFLDYDVYEVVDRPKNENILGTQWVIVDKEVTGKKGYVRKARLCMRGDQEQNVQNIHKDSPTVNKINIKLMLIEAVRKKWEISSSDVTRAFLQTSEIDRDVYVKPPKEAGVPSSKVWKLKRPAYGLIDAAHSFFINYADNLISLGCETCKVDNATFYHFSDGSGANDPIRNLNGILGTHIDDSIAVSDPTMKEEVLEKMKQRFTFGSHETLPFKYVGLHIEKEDNGIVINQDHFANSIEAPDLKGISSLKKSSLLPEEFQTKYRSLVSKLNMLSVTARPDVAFEVKVLTTRYGKAIKHDIMKAIKLLEKVKRISTQITIPDMGNVEDWILIAYSDAATKKIEDAFSVSGYVIFLVNKITNNATPITWCSKKIERVVNSSFGAEALGVVKLIGTLSFIKSIFKQMYGTEAGNIPCLTLIDSKDLYEAVHNIKTPEDKRLIGDILQIKQAIAIDDLISELRLIPSENMLADSLTKAGRSGDELLSFVRNGTIYFPGRMEIDRSEKLDSSTWKRLIQAQSRGFEEESTQGCDDGLGPMIDI